jgi:hypothetical protein
MLHTLPPYAQRFLMLQARLVPADTRCRTIALHVRGGDVIDEHVVMYCGRPAADPRGWDPSDNVCALLEPPGGG